MPDTRKPSRAVRDPRADSQSPPRRDESPLGRPTVRPGESSTMPVGSRVASLEAEIERLRAERAIDADETANMLLRIVESDRMRADAERMRQESERLRAEAERMRIAAQAMASESQAMASESRAMASAAQERACALQVDLDLSRSRIEELERSVQVYERSAAGYDQSVQGFESTIRGLDLQLQGLRATLSDACGLLEDLLLREEIAAGVRVRNVREVLAALTGVAPPAGAPPEPAAGTAAETANGEERAQTLESSVEIVGTHEWDLDLAE